MFYDQDISYDFKNVMISCLITIGNGL